MPDRVTAISFDTAVMTFGIWAENGLREGRSLEELLDIPSDSAPSLAENERQFAALRALAGGRI